jgi:hypothetical protein
MRKIKFLICSFFLSALLCSSNFAQVVRIDVPGEIKPFYFPPLDVVISGTFMYKFTLHLSEDGLVRMHWNAHDVEIFTEDGDKVKLIDTGNDSYGDMWDLWNNINYYNGDQAEYFVYPFEDGWLDEYVPAIWPEEGVMVNMSAKMWVKNKMFRLGWKHVVHINANGVVTVDEWGIF